MSVVIVTGSNGLVGSAAVKFLSNKGFEVIGIDNNMRETFFGKSGSTEGIGSEQEDGAYPEVNSLVSWATKNGLSWTIEYDIFIAKSKK